MKEGPEEAEHSRLQVVMKLRGKAGNAAVLQSKRQKGEADRQMKFGGMVNGEAGWETGVWQSEEMMRN